MDTVTQVPVVHSVSFDYDDLDGWRDVALGGVVCGPAKRVGRVYHRREIHGATLHPAAAYLLLRDMKTLALRIERQNAAAVRVAEDLRRALSETRDRVS